MARRETDILESYSVAYRSGVATLPHHKSAAISLNLTTHSLVLEPTMASRKFWERLGIPYERIIEITLAPHETSTVEGILGGIGGNNSSQLSTDNNVDIRFVDATGAPQLVRVEMVTGLSITGQAAIAHQLETRLDLHGLRARFGGANAGSGAETTSQTRPAASTAPAANNDAANDVAVNDIVDLISRLAQLNAAGALTDAEFAAKKTELLARL